MTVRPRRALARPTKLLEGVGIHSGAFGRVRILPADEGLPGIVFRHASTGDLLRAEAGNVVDTRRCTVLGSEAFTVQTVEHLLSACFGMGLTDATITVEGPEIPIFDGSALPFVEAISEAGLADLNDPFTPIILNAPIAVTDEGSTMIAYPAASTSVSIIIDYPNHPAIGVQAAVDFGVNYSIEVAPARTYGFISEIERLHERGLALGAGLETGVALLDDGAADPRTPLRFVNELARHKLLDVLGDLSLTDRFLQMGIVAIRPSHALTTRFSRLLASMRLEDH